MIFRKKSGTPPPEREVAVEDISDRKGRATPTRKQSEAARKRPLVAGDPKVAKKQQRERQNELYSIQRQAMTTGDPKLHKYLPPRDQGDARRFTRDFVDARWSLGELFLPIAIVIMFVMLVGSRYPDIALTLTMAMYVIVFAALIDSFVMVWFMKRRMKGRFTDEEIPKWTGFYAFQRAFMFRRFRMPRPMVQRGQWPHKNSN